LPNVKPFRIVQCVQEALEITPMPDNVQVSIDCTESLPQALADPDQLRIVFANLMRNAREAMPQGGALTVAGWAVLGGVEVAVIDTGVGIAPEHFHRVLEPLYSTKARGLGLGLAICRAILDKNNGSLHLASELGKGSTFTVHLPSAVPEESGGP
jgi:signal transduction histidine kinase